MKKIILFVSFLLLTFWLKAQEKEIDLKKVFCYRQIDKQNNTINVTLLVNTAGLEREKTLKIKEKFPTGFRCKIKEGYGSTNAVAENSVLFVWSVLPKSELFIVKYEISSPTALNESVNINGNVSFLNETGIKYLSVEQRDFTTNSTVATRIKSIPPYEPGSNAPASVQSSNITMTNVPKTTTPSTNTPDTNTAPKPKPIVRTNVKDEPIKTQVAENKAPVQTQPEPKPVVEPITPPTKPVKTEKQNVTELPPVNTNKNITKTTTPQTAVTPSGFYYTVQLGASSKPLPKGYYDKYQFDHPVDVLQIDNMYKYSVGKFQTLKEAKKYTSVVKQKGLQCFVVAYNNGKKISIKEALAISKQ